MFTNLRVEMVRAKKTYSELAKDIGISISTMSLKSSGKSQFTLDEALKIKDVLHTDLTIEELFREEKSND